jgi:hypothetical protein
MDWISAHGIVETTVSDVDDNSLGASAHVSEEIAFGVGAQLINVHKQLVSAYARVNGSGPHARLDCLGGQP